MAYKVKEEELLEYLPSNIVETELLTKQAKKVLGALHHWILHSQAQETGRIIIGNNGLSKIAGVSTSDKYFNEYMDELLKYGLVTRKAGKRRTIGEKNKASEYFINWDALEQPLVKIDNNQRFSAFKKKSGYIDKNSIDKNSIVEISKDKFSKDENILEENIKEENTDSELYSIIPKESELESEKNNSKSQEAGFNAASHLKVIDEDDGNFNETHSIIEALSYKEPLEHCSSETQVTSLAKTALKSLDNFQLKEPIYEEVFSTLKRDFKERLQTLKIASA